MIRVSTITLFNFVVFFRYGWPVLLSNTQNKYTIEYVKNLICCDKCSYRLGIVVTKLVTANLKKLTAIIFIAFISIIDMYSIHDFIALKPYVLQKI